MEKYLVITMDKSTHEIRKGYVEDYGLHCGRIEEYVDNIISQFGSVFWGAFHSSIDENVAMNSFLNHINWCNLGDIFLS